MIGQTIAHYYVTAKLGAGGMGEVFRATDTKLGRDVALKVLPAAVLSDNRARERLLREARTASRLNHPYICTVYEVGEVDGLAYIAMECVEGRTLSDLMEKRELPLELVLLYAQQIVDALAHAHERDVVHRDLKCANVMITSEGRAKVLDFGLAKYIPDNAAEATTLSKQSLTTPGTIAGTLAYMSPEQLCGKPADRRSDIWSFGVMFYEMLCGTPPFTGKTGFELSSAILNQTPKAQPETIPVPLRAVVDRCLAKDPAHRYQHGREALAALGVIQNGSGVSFPGAFRFRVGRRSLSILAGLVTLIALLTITNSDILRSRFFHWGTIPRIKSMAILPLENLSGDPEQEVIADGIHAALIADVARLGGFDRVIARQSVMRYRKTDKSISQIARELRVDAVMSGSFLRVGNRVQVAAQLIDAKKENNLWAGRYDREMRDVLVLQNEILTSMTREIKMQLTPQSQARLSIARTVNPEAYELYTRGRSLVNQLSPESIEKGLKYLHQAAEIDPSDPMPFAGLGIAYSLIGHSSDPEAYLKARDAAQKALELDDSIAEAHETLALISLYRVWDWKESEKSFHRALELNPNLADAHAHYGWYLQLMGRNDDALMEEKRAEELDPLNPVYAWWVGAMELDAGRDDRAVAEAQKSLELNPNFPAGHFLLGNIYAAQGKYDEAIAHHKKSASISPEGRWGLGAVYALSGLDHEARELADELKKHVTPRNALGLAIIYANLGDKDEAFRWMNTMCDMHDPWGPWAVSVRSGWKRSIDALRDDPRFAALLRRMNLPV